LALPELELYIKRESIKDWSLSNDKILEVKRIIKETLVMLQK